MPNEKDQEFREENKNDWISEYFELYKKGRQNKSPIDYIDYYESRHFILKLLEADRKIQKEEFNKILNSGRQMYEIGRKDAAEQLLKEIKELGYESKVTRTKTHSIPHNCLEYQTCLSECKEVVKKYI
jgi:hypothetical protein